MKKNKHLILIPGSTAEVGSTYLTHFKNLKKFETIGFTSNEKKVNSYTKKTNFLDKNSISKSLEKIDLNKYDKITLIHCIGEDKFEDWGYPISSEHNHEFICPQIYNSNYVTYENVSNGILKQYKGIIKFVSLGGTRDSMKTNPYQQSYSNSKNKLRELMKKQVINNSNVSSLMINVSSIDTGGDLKGRPYSDTSYWLKLDQLLDRTREIIPLNGNNSYLELTVLNPMPDFNKEIYYSDYETYKRRLKEVYNKEIREYKK